MEVHLANADIESIENATALLVRMYTSGQLHDAIFETLGVECTQLAAIAQGLHEVSERMPRSARGRPLLTALRELPANPAAYLWSTSKVPVKGTTEVA